MAQLILQRRSGNLADKELSIINASLTGQKIRDLPEQEIGATSMRLLFSISVITGWEIPNNDAYQETLTRQLYLKIKESYGSCTEEEILYAMRNYSQGVEEYGKPINLKLIDDVMVKYISEKQQLANYLERKRQDENEERKTEYTEEHYKNDLRKNAQISYRIFLSGVVPRSVEAHRNILKEDQLINDDEKSIIEYFTEWKSRGVENIYILK